MKRSKADQRLIDGKDAEIRLLQHEIRDHICPALTPPATKYEWDIWNRLPIYFLIACSIFVLLYFWGENIDFQTLRAERWAAQLKTDRIYESVNSGDKIDIIYDSNELTMRKNGKLTNLKVSMNNSEEINLTQRISAAIEACKREHDFTYCNQADHIDHQLKELLEGQ